ncbi:MAG: trehalose-phosphatase [Thermoleophilaceae bacterium]
MAAPTATALADALRPLTGDPRRAALFLDIDGTLASIVARAEDAHVPQGTSRLLGRLGRRYGAVTCVSGRSAGEARRLVGVGSIAYAGTHGAELLEPGARTSRFLPAFESYTDRVRAFVAEHDGADLRTLRVRIEDKGPIMAFHWRGAPSEEAAHEHLRGVAEDAEAHHLAVHWGRKVLEIRPPVPVDKGRAVREVTRHVAVEAALFAGDDTTDLDGFTALDELEKENALRAAVRVGIRSEEGPAAIVERADIVVDGVLGFVPVLETLVEG